MSNEPSPTTDTPVNTPQEESIFDKSEFELQGYDKHIKNARILLFVMAGIALLNIAFVNYEETRLEVMLTIGITVFVSAVFVALGFYTSKKPYTAILIALIFYGSLIVLGALVDPSSIIKGIVLKIIVIVLLIRGLNNGKEVERWRNAMGNAR